MIDGTYTAVVDRIVDGETVVIILEEDGTPLEQLEVGIDRLPERARTEGSVLSVSIVEDTVTDVDYRPEETRERRESAAARLDRLSKRLSDSDGRDET